MWVSLISEQIEPLCVEIHPAPGSSASQHSMARTFSECLIFEILSVFALVTLFQTCQGSIVPRVGMTDFQITKTALNSHKDRGYDGMIAWSEWKCILYSLWIVHWCLLFFIASLYFFIKGKCYIWSTEGSAVEGRQLFRSGEHIGGGDCILPTQYSSYFTEPRGRWVSNTFLMFRTYAASIKPVHTHVNTFLQNIIYSDSYSLAFSSAIISTRTQRPV